MMDDAAQRLRSALRNRGPRLAARWAEIAAALHEAMQDRDAERTGQRLAARFSDLEGLAVLVAQRTRLTAALDDAGTEGPRREALVSLVEQAAHSPLLLAALQKTFPHAFPSPPLRVDRWPAPNGPVPDQYQAGATRLRSSLERPGLVWLSAPPCRGRRVLLECVLYRCRQEQFPPGGTTFINLENARAPADIVRRAALALPGAGPQPTLRGLGWRLGLRERLVLIDCAEDALASDEGRTALEELLSGCLQGGNTRILLASALLPSLAAQEVALTPLEPEESQLARLPQEDRFAALLAFLSDLGRGLGMGTPGPDGERYPLVLFHLARFWPLIEAIAAGADDLPDELAAGFLFLGAEVALYADQADLAREIHAMLEKRVSRSDPGQLAIMALLAAQQQEKYRASDLLSRLPTLSDEGVDPFVSVLRLLTRSLAAHPMNPQDLRQAMQHLVADNQMQLVAHIHVLLGFQALSNDQPWDAERHLERAREICRQLDLWPGTARVLCGLGQICQRKGDLTEAEALMEQALSIFRETDETWKEAELQEERADLARARGDVQQQEERLAEALRLFEALEARPRQAKILLMQASEGMLRGHFHKTLPNAEQASILLKDLGDTQGEVIAQLMLAEVALITGRPERAGEYIDRARVLHSDAPDEMSAYLSIMKGMVAFRSGRPGEARQPLESALESARQINEPLCEARARYLLGEVEKASGRNEEARGQYEAALALHERHEKPGTGWANDHAEVLVALARLLWQDAPQAIEKYRQAIAMVRPSGNERIAARALLELAALLAEQQNAAAAQCHLAEAQEIFDRLADAEGACRCIVIRAVLATEAGSEEEAKTYLVKALARCRAEIVDPSTRADLLEALAVRTLALDHADESRVLYEESLALHASLGRVQDEVRLHHALADLEQDEERLAPARLHLERALDLAEQCGEPILVAQSLLDLACHLSDTEDLGEANLKARHAAGLFLSLGRKMEAANAMILAAAIHLDEGQIAAALPLYLESRRLARSVGNVAMEGQALEGLSAVLAQRGQEKIAGMLDLAARILAVRAGDEEMAANDPAREIEASGEAVAVLAAVDEAIDALDQA